MRIFALGLTPLALAALSVPGRAQATFSPGISAGIGSDTLAYTVSAMVEAARPVIGNELADEILSQAGGIEIGELGVPPNSPGVSNADTILLGTCDIDGNIEASALEAGMALAHEYQHLMRARLAGTNNDPLTGDPVCGACNHADMHTTEVGVLAGEGGTQAVCAAMLASIASATHWFNSCSTTCGGYAGSGAALDTAGQLYSDSCLGG